MKWSKPKRDAFSQSYDILGRKKGYKASVRYNDYYNLFYFITKKNDKVYNSCYDKKEKADYVLEKDCIKNYCPI